MKIRIFILTILSLVITLNSNAQCKFKTNELDPFTSEKHIVSKNIRLNGDMKSASESKFWAITNLEKTGNLFRWNFALSELAIRDKNSIKAIKLRLKTKSGNLELSTDAIPDPKLTLESDLKITQLDFYFDISIEQMKMLESGVDLVGIEIFGANKLFKTNSLEDIGQFAKCMLE